MRSLWASVAALVALVALVAPIVIAGSPSAAGVPVRVTDAWIRLLPGDLPAAGYATLTNVGELPLTLIGASSPDFGSVMFHQSKANQGMEQMSPVDSLPLAAHASVRFAPGGYHIMLMQPQHPVAPGDRLALKLHFAGGGSVVVPFEVRGADGRPVEPGVTPAPTPPATPPGR